jgi:prolyl 4-hydroxylase
MENFIYQEYLKDLTICDRLIAYHAKARKFEGNVFYGVNKNIKDSSDCNLEGDLMVEYVAVQLQSVLDKYMEKFPMCNIYSPFTVIEPPLIQHYKPSGGFKTWHTERTGFDDLTNRRHLVFMTYLNDVTDEGGTEFYHQKVKTTPKKGLTLIWPADWTYTHKGVVSPTQDKYIVTGWYSYVNNK